jgi:ATP-binding cassette subfamily B protein
LPNTPNTLTDKLRIALESLPHLPRGLALIWAATRGWAIAWAALLVVQGLLPVATVTLTRLLVDSLAGAIGRQGDWAQVRSTLLLAAAIATVALLAEALRSASGWVRTVQSELVRDHVGVLILKKSAQVDLAFYDSPAYHDRLQRAQLDAGYQPVALLESMGSLVQNGITLVAMVGVLVPYGLWLPVALVVSTLPALVVVLRHNLRQHEWRRRTTADERRSWYYHWVLTDREAAAEVRLFALGEHFRSAYRALRQRLRGERLRLVRDQGLALLGASVVALAIAGGTMAWMVWRALQGQATLGDLALFYQAFSQGQGLMRQLLTGVGQVYASSLFLGNLFEFLELEPQLVDPQEPRPAPLPLAEGIRFREVSFGYPNSERPALLGLNLEVPAGQIAAVVGANGAGKSTLIKLLCRLYDPDVGAVELDGIDVRDLAIEDLRRSITVLFQEPVRYVATAGENIALGSLATMPSEAATTGATAGATAGAVAGEVAAAAEAAGAEALIDRLPHGYDTMLGTWFEGGTDLSTGEWQRIALARAFLRQAPILVLDEPTSAMDSWAESDWLARFRALAGGRTAIVVTHRFTTAMHADVIHVMDEGRIVESGSHAELLARGGRYAQSWNAQMKSMAQAEGSPHPPIPSPDGKRGGSGG